MGQRLLVFIAVFFIASAGTPLAAPSRIIAIPSTDTLEYGAGRFDMETYNTVMKSGADGGWNLINYGVTWGLIPYTVSKSFGIEIGLDYRDFNGSAPAAADSPLFLNAKFALREGALFFDYFPAIAVGLLDYGGKNGVTNANIMYFTASETFFSFLRAGAGFYSGNGTVLVDENGKSDNSGPMVSLDWQVNKKWWAAFDWASGKSRYGTLNVGAGYHLHPDTKIIAAYVMFNNPRIKPAMSIQLLIDF